jgi:Mg2+ and Co2+ transporter CorA
MPTPAVLQSFSDTLSGLGSFSEKLLANDCMQPSEARSFAISMSNCRRHASTFIRTAKFLQQRCNNTATLVSDTVAFKNQGVAQEQNGNMLLLTRSALFLTVVTLFYLPWTLTTGLFGMNFFMMDQNTYRFVTSPKLWIYFTSAVALTACTMLLYYVMAGFPQLRKRQQKNGDSGIGMKLGLHRGVTDLEKSGGSGKKWS